MCHWPFQGGTPCIFPLINVCLFLCVFCVFVAIYFHLVFLSWFCAVRVAVCCVCCVSCMNSSLSLIIWHWPHNLTIITWFSWWQCNQALTLTVWGVCFSLSHGWVLSSQSQSKTEKRMHKDFSVFKYNFVVQIVFHLIESQKKIG